MEEFICNEIKFEDKELSELVSSLKKCYWNTQTNFAKVCFTIYNIHSYCRNNYWKAKDNEMYNSYKLLEKFGFDKKAVGRYKNCFEKYIQGNTIDNVFVKPYFINFSPSKLFELLPLSYDTLEYSIDNKLIRADMTVKQIRRYIKSLKDGTTQAEQVIEDTSIKEEEIPMAYDPKQKYEYSYFETKTKNQLLNMIWDLQREYQELKTQGEKTKNGKSSKK